MQDALKKPPYNLVEDGDATGLTSTVTIPNKGDAMET